MLHEKEDVRQIAGEPLRRWFSDEYLELIVWFSADGDIEGFELSYDMQEDWRAIKWVPEKGCQSYKVDDGESKAHKYKAVPSLQIQQPLGKEQMRELYQEFQARSSAIDADIAHFVAQQMLRYDPHPVKW